MPIRAYPLNATFSPVFPPAGHVAFSTQSGALGLAILEYAQRVNLGISTFASIGNKADVSSNDLIQYWADDPNTNVILLYLESFGNPRKFGQTHARGRGAQADRRGQSRTLRAGCAGGVVAHGRTGGERSRSSTRCSVIPASFARRRSKRCSMWRCCSIASRCRRGLASRSSPTPAVPASSRPMRAKAAVSPSRRCSIDTIDQLRAFLPAAASVQNPVDMLATASAADYGRAMRILLADPARRQSADDLHPAARDGGRRCRRGDDARRRATRPNRCWRRS